jgi:hypothetical protein
VFNPPDFPYVNYSKELSSFIHEVYKTDLMDTEYLPYLESHLPHGANYADYIETADFRLLRAILTYFVRQERFHEGLWMVAVQNGSFLKILNRLHESLMNEVIASDAQYQQKKEKHQ